MNFWCLAIVGLFQVATTFPQNSSDVQTFEMIKPGKYAEVGVLPGDIQWSWYQALENCQKNSGTLFIVDDAQESAWLGKRINQENKNLTRKPDKFWIGLVSLAGNGTLQWNSEEGITPYIEYPEVTRVTGDKEQEKQHGWAVPGKISNQYEYTFGTSSDLANGYVCQFV